MAKNVKTEKPKYDYKIGLQKTGKNVLIMFILPALLYVLSQTSELVPEEYLPVAIPLAGAVTYFVKNYIENK